MVAYMMRRFLLALLTIWIISILSFVLIQIPPGDAVTHYIEQGATGDGTLAVSEEQADRLREDWGLDKPMHVRYGKWMWNLLHGKLGLSFSYVWAAAPGSRTVWDIIEERLWLTVVLTFFTIVITWTFAIPVGIYSAVRQHSIGDYAFTFLGFTGLAVPDFLLGLVLMYIAFAYFDQSVGGLFTSGMEDAAWGWAKAKDLLNHLWIPAGVLGTSGTASLIRIMRNNLLDELSKPYVVTARAKGMSPWKLIIKYPVRVAINPLISTIGYLLPALVGGSIIVSVVLSLPTMGPVLLFAIEQQDTNLGALILLLLGTLTVIGTFISDLLLAVVDPRIRLTNQ